MDASGMHPVRASARPGHRSRRPLALLVLLMAAFAWVIVLGAGAAIHAWLA